MRHERRFIGGRTPIRAGFLNRMHGEQVRRSKVSLDNSLDGVDDSSGLALRGKARPAIQTIQLQNTGSAAIPAHGLIERTAYHPDSDTWDGQQPSLPGVVKIAIATESAIPPGQTGTAFAPEVTSGLVLVLADAHYPDGGAVDAGGWVATRGGSSTGQPVRGLTGLKIMAVPSPALPDGSVYCAFGNQLG